MRDPELAHGSIAILCAICIGICIACYKMDQRIVAIEERLAEQDDE